MWGSSIWGSKPAVSRTKAEVSLVRVNSLPQRSASLSSVFESIQSKLNSSQIRQSPERGTLTMKRLVTGLPKPCSTTRRISTIEDSVGSSHSRQQLGHQPRHPHAQQQIRNASSKVSRPRTALFFPGMSTLDFILNDSRFLTD